MADAQFPIKLQCLFQPKRFKVLWGGRGAGRSWGVARALLLLGVQKPIRVLCAREFQNSISESSHKVLSDQIAALGLEAEYEIQKQGIFGKNGTQFFFEGIKNNTTRIKSYEGVDICWVEEAVKVSRASWNILIPTIRKDAPYGPFGTGSEIWMTFNPELETDYTYKTFVREATDKDTIVVHMTYKDNPWFPKVLLDEAEKLKAQDYDLYLNVWEGQCLQMLEGVVYAKELRAAQQENRICNVPWDRETPANIWLDLGAGKSDKTAIWIGQRVAMQNRMLHYYENNMSDTLHYAKYLKDLPYTYDVIWLPHDAKAKKIGMKLTIEEQFRAHFPSCSVRVVPKLSLADGVNAARLVLPNTFFDEDECEEGIKALRHYRYKVTDGHDGKSVYSPEPMHDWASHGADAFRYMALTIKAAGFHKEGVLGRLASAKNALLEKARRERPGPSGWMG